METVTEVIDGDRLIVGDTKKPSSLYTVYAKHLFISF